MKCKKHYFISCYFFIIFSIFHGQNAIANFVGSPNNLTIAWDKIFKMHDVPVYRYSIIAAYPHDSRSFTEGLVLYHHILFESSGLYHQSRLRKTALKTGQLLQERFLPSQYFGEGITIIDNQLFQLSYQSNVGLIYDVSTLKFKKTFHFPTQGWGLTTDGKSLIMSDGSSSLIFMNPTHFNMTRFIIAHYHDQSIGPLNELEYIKGKIYANIYGTMIIAVIDPANGKIDAWIDLRGIYQVPQALGDLAVLNGIAYDETDDTLIVTGKFWPKIYKLKLSKQ